MAIIYRTDGAWGSGLGSNLSAAQVDNNFWELVERVVNLEESGIEPNNIASIEVIGSQMTIFMEDDTFFGPFTIPIAVFHWRGDWLPETSYSELDLVFVAGDGTYLVQYDHDSDTEFSALAVNEESNLIYFKIMDDPSTTLWLNIFFPGIPDGDAIVFRHAAVETYVLAQDLLDIFATSVDVPDNEVELTLSKNGTPFGTITYDVYGAPTVDTTEATLEPNDVFEITMQSMSDATFGNIGITIKATLVP